MDIINYALILILSFLGTFIGIILSNIAIEEITHVKKYATYANILLVSLIILLSIYSINKIYAIILAIISLVVSILSKNKCDNKWTYAAMGALLYISTINKEILYVTILIIIYGASSVTIDATKHFKNKINGQIKSSENTKLITKTLSKYSWYLLVGIIFYITFTYIL